MDPTLSPGTPAQTALQPHYENAMQDLLERMRLSPILGGKDFRQMLLERLDKFRIQIPPELPNWGADVDFDDAGKVALDDGIPLAYVPPAEIVTKILAAPTPADRRQVLVDETSAITAAFPEYTPLAQAAVNALVEGHHQGAQALAVNVTESFVREWIAEKYHRVKRHVLEADPAKADPNDPWIPSRLRLEMMIPRRRMRACPDTPIPYCFHGISAVVRVGLVGRFHSAGSRQARDHSRPARVWALEPTHDGLRLRHLRRRPQGID
jgi:hypothetical protein